MKKKIAILMALVCLVFCFEGISALADDGVICPDCRGKAVQQAEHLDDWKTSFNFLDGDGNSVWCNETHSMDRVVWYCTKDGKVVKREEPALTILSHSRKDCPLRGQK